MEDQGILPPPHVLILTAPFQSPLSSSLNVAELLCLEGFHVTVVLTEHIHSRLQSHGKALSSYDLYPGFQLRTISDGLPEDHPHSLDTFMELYDSIHTKTKVYFKEMLTSGSLESSTRRPVSCIISDSFFRFVGDVGKEIGTPIIYSRSYGACCLWIFYCIPKLIEAGEIPYKREDADALVNCVPGMESFLRRRDLPGVLRYGDAGDPIIQLFSADGEENPNGLILNTSEELEGPILSHIRSKCPNLYPIGPLHAHLKTKLAAEKSSQPTSSNSNGFWEEDRSCIIWLDAQPDKSVLYVTFGSVVMITKDQLLECWHGVVNSGKRFLWVMRQGFIVEKGWENEIPAELSEATKERGYMLGWAPQQEVLAHPAVGGMLCHAGWHTILEAMHERVPMICWPCDGEQEINSRFVEVIWKVGLDMKGTCDREIIEKMIKDLMDVRRDEFRNSIDNMAELVRNSLKEGGSSFRTFNRLVEDIKLMSLAY